MIFEHTPEEEERLAKIHNKYQRLISDSIEKAASINSEKGKAQLDIERRGYQKQLQNELDNFDKDCEQARFSKIENDPASIIKNAKEQIPVILKHYLNDITSGTSDRDTCKSNGWISEQAGLELLTPKFAAELLTDELQLHLSALKDNEPEKQKLFDTIFRGIKDSAYIDNSNGFEFSYDTSISVVTRAPLEKLTSFKFMNDKVNAILISTDAQRSEMLSDGQIRMLYGVNQSSAKEVPVYIALTYEGDDKGKLAKRMTGYDQEVYNAIGTQFMREAIEHPTDPLIIKPQEIWRIMNGKDPNDTSYNVNPAQIKKICKSIDKMRFTSFYIDYTKEEEAFGICIEDKQEKKESSPRDKKTYTREEYLLNASKVTVKSNTNGYLATSYRINDEPILLWYNRKRNRIVTVPYEMLDTSQGTSDSEYVAEFKGYLLRQIQLMKNAAENNSKKYFKRNNRVLISSIYSSTGVEPPELRVSENVSDKQRTIRKYRHRDREKIESLLTVWVNKNWIKGYKPVKEGQSVIAYDIDL